MVESSEKPLSCRCFCILANGDETKTNRIKTVCTLVEVYYAKYIYIYIYCNEMKCYPRATSPTIYILFLATVRYFKWSQAIREQGKYQVLGIRNSLSKTEYQHTLGDST